MIAILAAGEDAGANALASLLHDAGLAGSVITAYDDLEWCLHISPDVQSDSDLRLRSGERVTGLIVRSLPTADDGFVGAEQSASWWALAGSFEGPVVGRPTGSGVMPTIDRLRIDGAQVWQGRWALRTEASATSARHPYGGCARPASDGSIADYVVTSVAGDDVVDLTPCDPSSLRRLVVAGHRVLTQDDESNADESSLAWVTDAVASALPGLFSLVVDLTSHEVLDIGPVSHSLLVGSLGPEIAAGIRETLK